LWAAGRPAHEFDRLGGDGWDVAAAFAELKRRGVIPAGTESVCVGGAA
jgi:hypothetical protein